ncbi:MAG: DNA topoisomerase IB [Luteitalea sp.]|nr:DNA topoisomerase IB [Luteitalea sp.]
MRTAVRALTPRGAAPGEPLDPASSARVAGLRYVNDETTPGIRRAGPKAHVRYVRADGRPVKAPAELQRIRALAIPPAWTQVWICPHTNGHLQATGRDARGRKQYRYHTRWREVRDEVKYGRLLAFAQSLPRIREQTERDLTRPHLPREKVLAAVVQLLEKTLIRVGNEEYARENGSVGLTTMRDAHAVVQRGKVRFEFRGKSGIEHAIDLDDRRLARIVKACRDLPGYELFQYVDDSGKRQEIDSADVNAYLRETTGEEFTAKDFRTWAGTVLAAQALAAIEHHKSSAEARRNVIKAIESVARRLGNTKAVCRKCYIHPAILEAYMDGGTIQTINARAAVAKAGSCLSAEESAVVRIIEQRLRKKTA